MEKRGQAVLTILVLAVAVIGVFSFISLSKTPTGNSILDDLNRLFRGEEKATCNIYNCNVT